MPTVDAEPARRAADGERDRHRLLGGLLVLAAALSATLGGFLWSGSRGGRHSRGQGGLAHRDPAFRGVDHLALTVTDVARSRKFYVEVLGFTAVLEGEDGVLCIHKDTAFTLGLVRHQQAPGGSFSHLQTGLDHLGLVARDRAELEAWAQRLSEHDVQFSEITDELLGHHLNLQDPDGIALEFYAPNARYAAARDELRSRHFSDEEVRATALDLLGITEIPSDGASARVASGR